DAAGLTRAEFGATAGLVAASPRMGRSCPNQGWVGRAAQPRTRPRVLSAAGLVAPAHAATEPKDAPDGERQSGQISADGGAEDAPRSDGGGDRRRGGARRGWRLRLHRRFPVARPPDPG